jgi:hypothetical protein
MEFENSTPSSSLFEFQTQRPFTSLSQSVVAHKNKSQLDGIRKLNTPQQLSFETQQHPSDKS